MASFLTVHPRHQCRPLFEGIEWLFNNPNLKAQLLPLKQLFIEHMGYLSRTFLIFKVSL